MPHESSFWRRDAKPLRNGASKMNASTSLNVELALAGITNRFMAANERGLTLIRNRTLFWVLATLVGLREEGADEVSARLRLTGRIAHRAASGLTLITMERSLDRERE